MWLRKVLTPFNISSISLKSQVNTSDLVHPQSHSIEMIKFVITIDNNLIQSMLIRFLIIPLKYTKTIVSVIHAIVKMESIIRITHFKQSLSPEIWQQAKTAILSNTQAKILCFSIVPLYPGLAVKAWINVCPQINQASIRLMFVAMSLMIHPQTVILKNLTFWLTPIKLLLNNRATFWMGASHRRIWLRCLPMVRFKQHIIKLSRTFSIILLLDKMIHSFLPL